MGIFGDLDITQAADDPFAIKDGTYGAVITDASAGETKKGDKQGLTIEYTINDGSEMDDRKVSEWKEIPSAMNTAEEKRAASFLKRRLMDLEIPEARMNDVQPSDLIGTDVTITVKYNDRSGFTNVNRVTVRKGGVSAASPVSGATAAVTEDNPFLSV